MHLLTFSQTVRILATYRKQKSCVVRSSEATTHYRLATRNLTIHIPTTTRPKALTIHQHHQSLPKFFFLVVSQDVSTAAFKERHALPRLRIHQRRATLPDPRSSTRSTPREIQSADLPLEHQSRHSTSRRPYPRTTRYGRSSLQTKSQSSIQR